MAKKTFETDVAELAQALGMLVRRLRGVAAQPELSWSEISVLNRLAREGAQTTAELARVQGMKPQSMGTIVFGLEEAGMIERRPHPTDGRRMHLELTAEGVAAQKSAVDAKRTWLAQAISQLSKEEQATLFAAGEIVRRVVEQ